jgi:hypothetical protein
MAVAMVSAVGKLPYRTIMARRLRRKSVTRAAVLGLAGLVLRPATAPPETGQGRVPTISG